MCNWILTGKVKKSGTEVLSEKTTVRNFPKTTIHKPKTQNTHTPHTHMYLST